MTNIKFCGLKRPCDVEWTNEIKPQFAGFVFWQKSSRYVGEKDAALLKQKLHKDVTAVGVFVDAPVQQVARLLQSGVIDMAQLHGKEDEDYIKQLRACVDRPIIKAFKIKGADDIAAAKNSTAEFVLLDAGMGEGKSFDWSLLKDVDRRFFLAGGLDVFNVAAAIKTIKPYAVDISSGIETNGFKDKRKMTEFAAAVALADKEVL